MKKILIYFSILFGLPMTVFGQSGYKGYLEIESTLSKRILVGGKNLDLISYVGGYYSPYGSSLADLLGVYTAGTDSQFVNSNPNPLNVLIWNMIFEEVSSQFSSGCREQSVPIDQGPFDGKMNPVAYSALTDICMWPHANAKSDEVLLNFWFSILGFDSPEEEFIAFKEFFLKNYGDTPAKETIKAMVQVMLNQPYILIRQ